MTIVHNNRFSDISGQVIYFNFVSVIIGCVVTVNFEVVRGLKVVYHDYYFCTQFLAKTSNIGKNRFFTLYNSAKVFGEINTYVLKPTNSCYC